MAQDRKHFKTYWFAGGGRGQNPENTAQGNYIQNPIGPYRPLGMYSLPRGI